MPDGGGAAHLEALVNYERAHEPLAMQRVSLDRMRRLCRLLGDPQRRFRSVLVAGTNGKGSVCAMLYSMLRESSLRTGLYTSPHLEDLRERIRAWTAGPGTDERVPGDDWIPPEGLAAVVEDLRPAVEALRREPEGEPTYFEALTAAAFLWFARQRVDIAVLEVGLGGRLDATNVVEQAVSVIGPIDVDHADVLGPTPEAIAAEKAGIIKPNQVVFSAAQSPEVAAVLREACDAQGVPLFTVGCDLTSTVQSHDLSGLQATLTGLRGIYDGVRLPLIGGHQAQNAALAVGALEALSPAGTPAALIERGLSRVEWPGRLEVVNEQPLVLLDGAHNPHAAAALVESLKALCPGRRVHLLIGVSSDKAVESIGAVVGPVCASATCTASRHPRALDPTLLAKRLMPFCPDVHVMSDPADAYTYLLNGVDPKAVIVVTGSLFLAGELRGAIRRANRQNARRLQTAVP
jgi:dihydrofolate synthase/folylpolyglutamate synthase